MGWTNLVDQLEVDLLLLVRPRAEDHDATLAILRELDEVEHARRLQRHGRDPEDGAVAHDQDLLLDGLEGA